MVGALDPQPTDYWLEPCVGSGVFIESLRQHGMPRERIVAVDIEPTGTRRDRAAKTIRGVDFFSWFRRTPERFSRIVANPPYVPISRLAPSLRRPLLALQGIDGTSFSLGSNYWCAFLAASLRLLRDGGDLAFVLPAAWEYAAYANSVRDAVYSSFRDVQVHRCSKPLFPTVLEGCIVLIARGHGRTGGGACSFFHESREELLSALTASSRDRSFTATAPNCAPVLEPCAVTLGELYDVRIGAVTGDVNFFLLTERDRVEHDLPLSALRPVLSKARHLNVASIARRDWERLLRKDERVWLFNPTRRAHGLQSVQRYIELGEEICNLRGYKLRNRPRWFEVPVPDQCDGFMSGMSTAGPWIAIRAMKGLVASNTLYVLKRKNRMSRQEEAAWALSLLTSAARGPSAGFGRRYAGGLIKYEPKDLRSIPLPTPVRTLGAVEVYEKAILLLLAGNESGSRALADAFVFRNGR
jgi:adenine-specific DNA-methyltransferase